MLTALDMDSMRRIAPFRDRRLFSEFLPCGYRLTTLNSVNDKACVIELKVILGTLITLYDDFADRPDRLNPGLLRILYRLPFEKIEINAGFLNAEEKESLALARSLFARLMAGLDELPHYSRLAGIFRFDLMQFFMANHYSELVTQNPHLANGLENRLYLHHNMGIVKAGMIDLMSLSRFEDSDLARARELFLLGQRAGRISNVLATFERERRENDRTNEIAAWGGDPSAQAEALVHEVNRLFERMEDYRDIRIFSAGAYREGIQSLHELHMNLKGVI